MVAFDTEEMLDHGLLPLIEHINHLLQLKNQRLLLRMLVGPGCVFVLQDVQQTEVVLTA